MHFPRTKLIEKFNELFTGSKSQYIVISGALGIGKSTFIELLKNSNSFVEYEVEHIVLDAESSLESLELNNKNANLLIIDSNFPVKISKIRSFIESNSPDSRIIISSDVPIMDSNIENFILWWISFREYCEWMGHVIDIQSIMSWKESIQELNTFRDSYIHLGQYIPNLNNPENIQESFDNKLSIMNQELFKKEEWDFLEFIRTVAMNVGDIFKEERIAKNMNISRRKVRKYTEIILKHDLIKAIGPWVENTTTELSRHVKVYFADLAYYHAALGVWYYLGDGKQGVIENFILLELDRKLSNTHEIRFYRKKSGAEVSFILIETSTKKLTPVIVTTKSSGIIPQSLKSFQESYGSGVEHAMILNDNIIEQKELNGAPVIIIPHVAI